MIYISMLIFDFAVLAGCVYLIDQRDWSEWTMLFGLLICAGSNPYKLINNKTGEDESTQKDP